MTCFDFDTKCKGIDIAFGSVSTPRMSTYKIRTNIRYLPDIPS